MVKFLFVFSLITSLTPIVRAQLPAEEVTRIAEEAFVYGYPIEETSQALTISRDLILKYN